MFLRKSGVANSSVSSKSSLLEHVSLSSQLLRCLNIDFMEACRGDQLIPWGPEQKMF